MGLADLLQVLGEEIQDPEEESFLLFSQADRSSNLGFVNPKERFLEISVADQDFIIEQSPSLLNSNRAEGTTGAVVWKITPLFANWIAGKTNVFFETGVLNPSSTVLELGCGVSGILPLAMSTKIGRYIATDQEYVFKMLRSNLKENAIKPRSGLKPLQRHTKSKPKSKSKSNPDSTPPQSNIEILALDWETSSTSSLPDLLISKSPSSTSSPQIDAILACDCIYNEALIDPFIQTCVDLCNLTIKNPMSSSSKPPTTTCIIIIAQQLRSPTVFETWLLAFHERFRVWRVPDRVLELNSGLLQGSGYVIHIAILREEVAGSN